MSANNVKEYSDDLDEDGTYDDLININGILFRDIPADVDYIPLRNYPGYLISTSRPYNIINAKTLKVIHMHNINGYKRLALKVDDNKFYKFYHHRIIKDNLMPITDNSLEIDHINHVRNCNNICNLRAVTHKENNHNRTNSVNDIYHQIIIELSQLQIEQQLTKITHINHDLNADNYFYNNVDNKIYIGCTENTFRLCDELIQDIP